MMRVRIITDLHNSTLYLGLSDTFHFFPCKIGLRQGEDLLAIVLYLYG